MSRVSKKLRFEILRRDDFACQYCGQRPPDTILEVDHIHPFSAGGTNAEENLITACFDCNRGKKAGLVGDITALRKRQDDEAEEASSNYLNSPEGKAFLKKCHTDRLNAPPVPVPF